MVYRWVPEQLLHVLEAIRLHEGVGRRVYVPLQRAAGAIDGQSARVLRRVAHDLTINGSSSIPRPWGVQPLGGAPWVAPEVVEVPGKGNSNSFRST